MTEVKITIISNIDCEDILESIFTAQANKQESHGVTQ